LLNLHGHCGQRQDQERASRCGAVHREGEGEVAGAASGAALVLPEHGGSLGVAADSALRSMGSCRLTSGR